MHLHNKCSSSGCTYLHQLTGLPMGHLRYFYDFVSFVLLCKFLKFNIILQKPFRQKKPNLVGNGHCSCLLFRSESKMSETRQAPNWENCILCHADIFCVALTVFYYKKGVKMVPKPKLLNSYFKSDFEVYFPQIHLDFFCFCQTDLTQILWLPR